jgi:hypothetical protein
MNNDKLKDKFNRYCLDVMGYEHDPAWFYDPRTAEEYNPYDDLNQIAEVFDKLWIEQDTLDRAYLDVARKGIKHAMRDYIISTMQVSDE